MTAAKESSVVGTVRGRGISVRGNEIDTDRIIPARYMKTVTFAGLEAYAFADARADARRHGEQHPFDRPEHAGASILLVNKNFGCGSSREHAPQALHRWGIKAVVGESFAEIFFGNCVAMGVPCLTVSAPDAAVLQSRIEREPETPLQVLLETQEIVVGAGDAQQRFAARMPEGPRRQFLSGNWDALAVLLDAGRRIEETAARLPYAFPRAAG